ncbi:MOSC domain-containing protein [Billgrantia saliphila]|uniref:MOSC domain-containing protein n=1 Tax=Billgrantia saliphila TaxID=1848458 RepID=UPI000CE471C3|nr:MOSC domain-containing protein [Halomonas saliphila]
MAKVVSVSRSSCHHFSKEPVDKIMLIEGEGVDGDAHKGKTVKHRSRVKKDPSQPNLRQIHIIHLELIEELQEAGFRVGPATMGENITTSGIDVLSLPTGTILSMGNEAKLEVTGLRNPCAQLDNYQQGLTAAVLGRDEEGNLVRRAGIMCIVISSGVVRPGDQVKIQYPKEPHRPLLPV